MRPPSILLPNAWYAHEGARLSVASPPGLERSQQALGIYPVGFDATRPPVHFQARRIHDATGNPGLDQTAVQPEPIITGLEHALDPDRRFRMRLHVTLTTSED